MSDLIRREDALGILEDEGWVGDSLRRIHALPAVQPDAREAAFREALAAVNAKWRSGAADTPDEMRGLALAEAAILAMMGESHE